jgi:hypothetical protein
MRTFVAAMMFALVIGLFALDQGTAYGQVYAVPTVVQTYYPPAPVYTYTTPYAYPAPVVVPVRRWAYSPVIAPVTVAPQVVVTTPMVVASPVVIGPAGRVYIPGRPIRNTVRVVWP